MIEFKSDKEKEIVFHYAQLLDDKIIEIISKDGNYTENDVRLTAKFYWNLVELSIKEKSDNSEKFEDMDMWLERIYTSFHIHFGNLGYEKVWDNEIPES